MTRGTAYLVTDNYIIESLEFNGDMYRDGCGQEMVDILSNAKTSNDFKKGIETFNQENHKYQEFELNWVRVRSNYIEENTRGEDIVQFTDENYFKLYFSDWTFWKNLSSKEITFRTREGGKIVLPVGEVVAINFGNNAAHYFGTEKQLDEMLDEIMP